MSDNQRGYTTTSEVADFFLKAFLGCQLVESPAVATKKFFNVTEGFITHEVTDPEAKARYETALLAELNNDLGTLNPADFADRNLKVEDRQPYREWFQEQDAGFQQFDKDIQLVKTRLRRVSVNFESGVSVLVPPDSLGEQVLMSDTVDGRTRMEIEDRLTNVEGKS